MAPTVLSQCRTVYINQGDSAKEYQPIADIKLDGLSMIQKICWSSYEFYKTMCETRSNEHKLIARSISLSIMKKTKTKQNKTSNFIIIMFRIWYFYIFTDITDRYFWHLVGSEHHNVGNQTFCIQVLKGCVPIWCFYRASPFQKNCKFCLKVVPCKQARK